MEEVSSLRSGLPAIQVSPARDSAEIIKLVCNNVAIQVLQGFPRLHSEEEGWKLCGRYSSAEFQAGCMGIILQCAV